MSGRTENIFSRILESSYRKKEVEELEERYGRLFDEYFKNHLDSVGGSVFSLKSLEKTGEHPGYSLDEIEAIMAAGSEKYERLEIENPELGIYRWNASVEQLEEEKTR